MQRRVRTIGVALVLAVAVVSGLEAYTRTPDDVRASVLDIPPDTRTLVLLFHGSGDAGDPFLEEIIAALERRYATEAAVAVRLVNWQPWSEQRLRAAANARLLGDQLGRQVATLASLQVLHLVAHSSGGFVPDALCESYRQHHRHSAGRLARIEMDLLDPFQIDGFVDWTWGARNHGRCADQAIAIINTDDFAPATNRLLRHARNIDVTAVPRPAGFARNGHYWPLVYYRDWIASAAPALAPPGEWIEVIETPAAVKPE